MITETIFAWFLVGFVISISLIFGAAFYHRLWWRTYWKQVLLGTFIFCLFGIVSLTCYYFLARRTLASGQQCNPKLPSICWGYRVEEYPPCSFCTLTFWHSWRVKSSFSFPKHFVSPTVAEQRWLANGTAVYIFLDNVNTDNSYVQKQKVRVIYDFESGEIYAEKYSAHWLNSTLDSRLKPSLSLSESDFESKLLELENAR